jgi:hypothetical protein
LIVQSNAAVGLYVSIYGSDSQLRCRKEVSGVPQNLELLPFIDILPHEVPPSCHF